jgi:hypothetical protein
MIAPSGVMSRDACRVNPAFGKGIRMISLRQEAVFGFPNNCFGDGVGAGRSRGLDPSNGL